MLLKIICVSVLVVLGDLVGSQGDDEIRQEYHGEANHDHYGMYNQDDNEEFDFVRVKRFGNKPTVKTLSPQEIQEVRGAINQILLGHNEQNPFTPLPPKQGLNEKRSVPDSRANQKRRSLGTTFENYPFNAETKFNDYTDAMDNTRLETQTFINEPLTTDDPGYKTPTLKTGNEYDTVLTNDFIGATTHSLSSLPGITGTDEVTNTDIKSVTTDEIAADRAITEKTTETINYETETNVGLTGATINAFQITSLPRNRPTRTPDNIKSEINSILGFNADVKKSAISGSEDKDENNLDITTTNALPLHSPLPGAIRTDNLDNYNTDETRDKIIHGEGSEEEDSKDDTAADSQDNAPHLDAGVQTEGSLDGAAKEESHDKLPHVEAEPSPEEGITELKPNEAGSGPESVSEAVSKGEEEFEKGVNEEHAPTTEDMHVNTTQITEHEGSEEHTQLTTSLSGTQTQTSQKPTKTRTTTTKFQLDVPALLAIIANLTYDYEMNLTDNLNATLLKYSIPTCETPTTTTTKKKGIFIDYEANATGVIVAKCFVCGLEVEKIPRSAHCADAFAGDFIPLVPVDMTARGQISKYRKYCRFADVPHYVMNETQPRSVFGRWTGGCSVRWIDLSGVYTQRSCRNRDRAIHGRHFASKRMAKLEMALSNVENGCIASPMATLVPLSRGISLYARFHACVCTGSWCNAAELRVPWPSPWTTGGLVPLLVAYISPHLLI